MKSWHTSGAGGILAMLGIACPVCIPAIAGMLASAGVLITVSVILKPLFALMLAMFWFGLWWAYRRHKNIWPLVLGIVFGVAAYWMRYVWYFNVSYTETIAWYDWRITLPAVLLIVVAYWNYRLDKKHGTCTVPTK